MSMKIIFLDIDGVLNHELFYRDRHEKIKAKTWDVKHPQSEFDPSSVLFLNDLIKDTGAKVVISSTWRMGRDTKELRELMASVGFVGEIIDKTPIMRQSGVVRGNEIHKWIMDHTDSIGCATHEYRHYVILDDDSDMLYWQRNNFLLVDRHIGLTPNVCYRAKRILNS